MSPSFKWVVFNSDWSVIVETGRATARDLLYDVDGRCLATYSNNPWDLLDHKGCIKRCFDRVIYSLGERVP
ncbi:hypothetical protein LINGRAHAP2_LOCUS18568 [Linum grandiflorum]